MYLSSPCTFGSLAVLFVGWGIGISSARGQCEIDQDAKLTLPGQSSVTPLGVSVSIDGDDALVGNHVWTDFGGVGFAHVFHFDGLNWALTQDLVRSGPGSGEGYGRAIAMDGDVAVVGAGNESPSGAVYVFRRVAGAWAQEQRLTPSDSPPSAAAGRSIAVSGDVLVAGAPLTTVGAGALAGAAYVYRFNGALWVEEQKLTASDPEIQAFFGTSVAIDGAAIIIGADHDNQGASDAGASYVFRHNGATWVQEQKLFAPMAVPNAAFGASVSIDGDQIAVGSIVDNGIVAGTGAVYVFLRSGGTWSVEQKVVASDLELGDNLGFSVAIDGDLLLASAPRANTHKGVENGSTFVFRRVGGIWVQEPRRVASDPVGGGELFGFSVSLKGNRALVGAPVPFVSLTGAYIYEIAAMDCNGNSSPDSADLALGTSPDCQPNCVPDECDLALLASTDCNSNDVLDECEIDNGFGADCNVNGQLDSCDLISAESSDCNDDAVPDGCSFPLMTLQPTGLAPSDQFGNCVDIDQDWAVVGAPSRDSNGVDSGSAYIFRRAGNDWQFDGELLPIESAADDAFGTDVGVDAAAERIVCGAPNADGLNASNAGAAFVFQKSGTQWIQEVQLLPTFRETSAEFGSAVAIRGDRIVVGAPNGLSGFSSVRGGSAYVFRLDGANWVQEAELSAPIPDSNDKFGIEVAIDGDRVAIGCSRQSQSGLPLAGAVYVFRRESTTWVLEQQLIDSSPSAFAELGDSLDLDDTAIIVGAKQELNSGGFEAGAAVVFRRTATTWLQEAKLLAPDAGRGDRFGTSVSISRNVAVVGAVLDDDPVNLNAGSAYVFRHSSGSWVVETKLVSNAPQPIERFGAAVAIDDGSILIGADQFGSPGDNQGTAYAFQAVGGDCDLNNVLDLCDILACTASPGCDDCNRNAVPDMCDIAGGFSVDVETDGVPDECQAPHTLNWNTDPLYALRANRSITISATTATASGGTGTSAIQVRMIDLQNPVPPNAPCCQPQNFSAFESATCTAVGETGGCNRWVGPVQSFFENTMNPGAGTFRGARLQCAPYYFDWTTEGDFSVFGAEIVPSSAYEVRAFGSSCKGDEGSCLNVSTPITVLTRRWGDMAGSFNPPSGSGQPDGIDVTQMVNKFRNLATAPTKRVSILKGHSADPNLDIDGLDIVAVVDAFRGFRFPFSGPCVCPSTFVCGATACTADFQCSGGTCVKTCVGGAHAGLACITNALCPGSTCGAGFCRDRCGRCSP